MPDSILKKLKAKYEKHLDDSYAKYQSIDPTEFDDPVAQKTEWTPLQSGGSKARIHTLHYVGNRRLEFRIGGIFVLILVFIIPPLAFMLAFFLNANDSEALFAFFLTSLICIPLICIGFYGAYVSAAPIIFNKATGYFKKGKFFPIFTNKFYTSVQLKHIYAIQLLSEHLIHTNKNSNKKTPYSSYEINLVLASGKRVNVIDQGDEKQTVQQAKQLALFLNIPLWNVINKQVTNKKNQDHKISQLPLEAKDTLTSNNSDVVNQSVFVNNNTHDKNSKKHATTIVDASVFNDPIAEKTMWHRVTNFPGPTFYSHRPIKKDGAEVD